MLDESEALKARVAELEAENEALRQIVARFAERRVGGAVPPAPTFGEKT